MLLPATWIPGAPAQDLRVTPHNLARQAGAAAAAQADAGDLCVFCHVPSAAGREGAAAEPLWQRSIGAAHAFAVYDDPGLGLVGRIGSHSLVCLSCHDATQAENAAIPRVALGRDHPVGIPYRGAVDGSINPQAEYRAASRAILDGKPAWWVSRSEGGTRSREDLPLFRSRPAEGEEPVPMIECATCHDPHTAAPQFLRVSTKGSQLCLTCHDK